MGKETKEKGELFDFFINHSKKAFIGILLLVLFALIAATIGLFYGGSKIMVDESNVVAEVAGEKIYLDEYRERLFAANGGYGTPENPQIYAATESIKESVLTDLADSRIIDKELIKNNLSVSDAELTAEAKKVFKDYDTRDKDVQNAYKKYVSLRIGKAKLAEKVVSWREGYVLLCLYTRADMPDMASKPDSASIKARDKAYAEEYCKAAKQRLESGQSNFTQELEKLKADATLGLERWKPMNMTVGSELKKTDLTAQASLPYDLTNKMSENKNTFQFLTLEWPENLEKVDVGEKPNSFTAKESAGSKPAQEKGKDVGYGVAYTSSGYTGQASSFMSWLTQKQSEYKVKTYIERIKL